VGAPDPDLILRSPLGRQFLAGLLGLESFSLYEQLGLGRVPGTVPLARSRWTGGYRPPLPHFLLREVQRARDRRSGRWQDVAPDEVRAVFSAAVRAGEWREEVARDELGLLSDLASTTSSFGFSPSDEAVWGLTALAGPELRPVAEALLRAPGAATWWEPAVLSDQRFLHWDGYPRPAGPAVAQAVHDGMRAERAENEELLSVSHSRVPTGTRTGSHWWSAPDFAELTWTTSAAGDIPAAAFGHFIDTLWPFQETGVTVWSLQVGSTARVLEITGPDAWQKLVARFPRDVTGTHDGTWRDWGGAPGPWRLPDWEQVMDHYDGVHVTVGGYLASCGLALPVAGGFTMLAGWIPGATLWLRDMTTASHPLGRWHGHPQSVDWGDVRDHWIPGAEPSSPAPLVP
jgi:hypothetical protein